MVFPNRDDLSETLLMFIYIGGGAIDCRQSYEPLAFVKDKLLLSPNESGKGRWKLSQRGEHEVIERIKLRAV